MQMVSHWTMELESEAAAIIGDTIYMTALQCSNHRQLLALTLDSNLQVAVRESAFETVSASDPKGRSLLM